jgi:protein-disulfide isomerase
MTDNSSNEPIRLPGSPSDEPRREDVVQISQSTILYFVVAVVFFAAGFVIAWITFATTAASTNAQDLKSAAASGAREAVQTEVAGLQATTVGLVSRALQGQNQGAQAPSVPQTPVAIAIGNSPVWGSENAKVTIIEYSDFQCPYCARFFNDTYGLIKEQYGDKIRFVYKHFPLTNIHPDAERAAIASECAREQGKFWEFHDIAYVRQSNLSREGLINIAASAGVANADQFTQCLDSQKYISTVTADYNEAITLGLTGTPTFFVNGVALVGAQPFQVFKATIDRAVASAG